jgi:hypothetical protein
MSVYRKILFIELIFKKAESFEWLTGLKLNVEVSLQYFDIFKYYCLNLIIENKEKLELAFMLFVN